MIVEQIYTGCLAQGAYYIESNGEAAIIDPLRDPSPYLEKAARNNATIKYVFETHFHADFVSGHIDLAKLSGAEIIFGPLAETAYPVYNAKDGEEFKIGALTIKALHTPGHTPESTTFLLLNELAQPYALFTGDTLFIGDVGRPDLASKSGSSKEQLASQLYASLREKIMPLPNHVLVYPAHGAGSACGKNLSKETFDTLGNQKKTNYALRADMTLEEFVKEVTDGLTPPPIYFPENVKLNKLGYTSFGEVLTAGLTDLDPSAFEAAANATDSIVLDTRKPAEFVKGHIPNSVFIGIDGDFAPWVGKLIPSIQQPLLIVAEPGREQEVITRLARIGYDHVIGYLKGGFNAWTNERREIETIESISPELFAERYTQDNTLHIVDVRKESEFVNGHLIAAQNLPLDELNSRLAEVSKDEKLFIHCAGGYRSVIAASILKLRGFTDLVNIEGGYNALSKIGLKTTVEHEAKVS